MIDSNSDQNAIIGDLASLPFSCFCIDAPTIDPSVKTSEEVLNQNQIFVRFKFWYLFSRISDSDDHQTNIKIRKKDSLKNKYWNPTEDSALEILTFMF